MLECSVEGCMKRRKYVKTGWCSMHYWRWQKYGNLNYEKPDTVIKECSIDDCTKLAKARGWCNQHWQRWSKYGDPLGVATTKTIEQRFWANVVKSSDDSCWVWQGYIDVHGYGALNVNGIPKHAYRISYEIHNGDIPHGMQLDHKCRNRACVNPNQPPTSGYTSSKWPKSWSQSQK